MTHTHPARPIERPLHVRTTASQLRAGASVRIRFGLYRTVKRTEWSGADTKVIFTDGTETVVPFGYRFLVASS